FPKTILKNANEHLLENTHKNYSNPLITVQAFTQSKKNTKRVKLLLDEELHDENHYLLEFTKNINIFVTPNMLASLNELVKVLIQSATTVADIVDIIERNNPTPKPRAKHPPPKWTYSDTKFSISLNGATIHVMQSVSPPQVLPNIL